MMKRILPDLIAIVLFALLSLAYFFPADIEGRILFQHDTAAGVGVGQEAAQYHEETGKTTRWTNSLFGGMPTYQIAPSYDSQAPLRGVQKVYQLFLPTYVHLTFILMLGFYILLRAFGIPVWLSGLGGVLWAFSSYFFILISAGHIWKFITLAYIPPTIAGIVLAYRGRLLWGGIVTALFLALQIMSNHVQMSYYFLFVILFIVGAYFEKAWREKTLPQFFRASAVLVVAALIGICANLSNIYHTYTYSKESMRGPSELVQEGSQAANQTGSGLDRDYITQWSYGIGETWTLLVPNYKGGASVPLAQNETAMEKADPRYAGLYRSLTQYFGEQPMTSGPVYVGAFVLFLFLLGCFIVKGPLKWALVGATFFSIVLSWGKNFMPLTDFFIDYIPLYNKFRAVSSILVVAEFTIPLLAIFALKKILEEPSVLRTRIKSVGISLLLTAGVALWYGISSGGSHVPTQEAQLLQSAASQGMIPSTELAGIMANLSEMRAALVQADAWRSFIIILIGCALLWLYATGKLRRSFTLGGIALLCLVDLWGVNKRYLNDSQFVPATTRTETFRMTEADKQILQDKTLDYRVLLGSGRVLYIGDVEPVSPARLSFEEEDQRALAAAVKLGSEEQLAEVLHQLLERVGQAHLSLDQCHLFFWEMVTGLLRLARASGVEAEQVFGPGFTGVVSITDFASLDELGGWLQDCCRKLRQALGRQRTDSAWKIVEQARQLIEENYADSDLSVEMVCDRLHLSPAYFSTLFKRETGMSFTACVTARRMEQAAALLRHTDEKTYLIAEKTGYLDPNYFSYVFKRHFGLTPSKYRAGQRS